MPDVEGTGQREPRSRISRWEDTNGDGTYDKRTVFADKLVLPRIGPAARQRQHPHQRDRLGRRHQADRHERRRRRRQARGVLQRRRRSAATATSSTSRAASSGGSTTGSTAPTTRSASAGRRPASSARPPDRTAASGASRRTTTARCGSCARAASADRSTSRCRSTTAPSASPTIRAGLRHRLADLRPGATCRAAWAACACPIGTVNHATATGGPDIVRGHRVPEDLVGDLLFAEPVGRLIRRAKIVKTEGLTQLRNAYPDSEFILSTDPLFRPVNMRDRARRHGLHRRHVSRHHPGRRSGPGRARTCG